MGSLLIPRSVPPDVLYSVDVIGPLRFAENVLIPLGTVSASLAFLLALQRGRRVVLACSMLFVLTVLSSVVYCKMSMALYEMALGKKVHFADVVWWL